MPKLLIYKKEVKSIFELLGDKENHISFSVGWAFSNCREFLQNFLLQIKAPTDFDLSKVKILLQRYEHAHGFTDFEILQEGKFHIIIEAKRGWSFPTRKQLEKYAKRKTFRQSSAPDKRIIIFNESTPDFTKAHFKIDAIASVPVEVLSWKRIRKIAAQSLKLGRDSENRLLRELNHYLEGISTMQKMDSNWVYVVSLGFGNPAGWKISWRDIVNKKRRYFHPVGGGKGGWPQEPPNYVAFRYDGRLQSIHHVDDYKVFTNPRKHFKEAPAVDWEECYLYDLGPAIKPEHEVRAGKKIVRSMRVWAMLDLLLTCRTIQEARDKSNEREEISAS